MKAKFPGSLAAVCLCFLFLAIPLTVAADDFQKANLEASWQRFDREVAKAKELFAKWEANPTPENEAAYNSVATQIQRLFALNMATRKAIETSEDASSVGTTVSGTVAGTAGDIASGVGKAVDVVWKPICSLSTWLLGTSDEELYGPNWKECEAHFERLRNEARQIRTEIEQLKKFPHDAALAAQVDKKRQNLKKKFESLRQMYRLEQRNLGFAGEFWYKGVGPHIEAIVDSFNSQDWTDLVGIVMNGIDPMTIYNLIRPGMLTQIGRAYVPPLTDPIAQSLTFDILGAGGSTATLDKLKGLALGKGQSYLQDKLKGEMVERFAASLPSGMNDEMKARFYKYLQEKWWDKLPQNPQEAYGKYLATFLMEQENREKMKGQLKKFLIDKSKGDAAGKYADKLDSKIGDFGLITGVATEFITLTANSGDWKNAMEGAANTCRGFREEYRKKIAIPIKDGGLDRYELEEDDYVTQLWFQARPAREPKLVAAVQQVAKKVDVRKPVSEATKRVAQTPPDQQPPVTYDTFRSYLEGIFRGVADGSLSVESFVASFQAFRPMLDQYSLEVLRHLDLWYSNTPKSTAAEAERAVAEVKRLVRQNYAGYHGVLKVADQLSRDLQKASAQKLAEIRGEANRALGRLASAPFLPVQAEEAELLERNYTGVPVSYKVPVYYWWNSFGPIDMGAVNGERNRALESLGAALAARHEPEDAAARVADLASAISRLDAVTRKGMGIAEKMAEEGPRYEEFFRQAAEGWQGYLEKANYNLALLRGSRSETPQNTGGRAQVAGIQVEGIEQGGYGSWTWQWDRRFPYEPLGRQILDLGARGKQAADSTAAAFDWASQGYLLQLAELKETAADSLAEYRKGVGKATALFAALADLYPPADKVMAEVDKIRFGLITSDAEVKAGAFMAKSFWQILPYLEKDYLKARRAYEADPAKLGGLLSLAGMASIEATIRNLKEVETLLKKVRIGDLDEEDQILGRLAGVWGEYGGFTSFAARGRDIAGSSAQVNLLAPPFTLSEQAARNAVPGWRWQYQSARNGLEKIPFLRGDLADLLALRLSRLPPTGPVDGSSAYARVLANLQAALRVMEEQMLKKNYQTVLAYEGNLRQGRLDYQALGLTVAPIQAALDRMAALLAQARDAQAVVKDDLGDFYRRFREAYEAKNEAAVMALLGDGWESGDGTTLADLSGYLRNSFTVFDQISYDIANMVSSWNGNSFSVSYEVTITGKIFENSITHVEKSTVQEEVAGGQGRLRIVRTLNGRFWYVK